MMRDELRLWIFESKTLGAMLRDAQRVAAQPANHEDTRAQATSMVGVLTEELRERGALS